MLAACVAVTKPLWRLDEAASGCSHAFGTLVSKTGDVYQTCSLNGDPEGWFRKLSADAVEQWRQPVSFWSEGGVVSDADNSVILFHDHNQISWINADGTPRWNRDVVPQGANIFTHSRVINGRVYLAYESLESRTIEGIVALDTTGKELWSYRLDDSGTSYTRPAFAVLDSGELMVKLTLEDQASLTVSGELLVFDNKGNVTQQRKIAKYAQLIDNQKTAFLIEKSTISKLNASGGSQWSHEFYPWNDQYVEDPVEIPCAGDGALEMACGLGNTVTWLAGDGSVIKNYSITESADSSGIRELTYNGDHKWVATRQTMRDVPVVGSQKTETFSSLFVLTDKGTLEQKITLTPMIETSYFCPKNPPSLTCIDRSNGDIVSETYATADKVFAVGNTTNPVQTFISVFALGAH